MKVNFTSVVFIVLVSSVLGLIVNSYHSNGIPLLKEERVLSWSEDSVEVTSTIQNNKDANTFDEAKAITLKKAYLLYNNNAVFIDARDYVEYEIGHIKGAISLPYIEFEKSKSVLDTVPKDTPLVAYCDGKECDLSIMLGDQLFEIGYKEVYIFYGGWIDWQMAQYPIEEDEEAY